MVADGHAVGNAVGQERRSRVFEPIHRVRGREPFHVVATAVTVVHDVAEVGDEHDVARLFVRHDPVGLRLENIGRPAVGAVSLFRIFSIF